MKFKEKTEEKLNAEETSEISIEDAASAAETEDIEDGGEPSEPEEEPAKKSSKFFKKKPPAPDYEKQYAEMLDRYQRTLAEFDNFRKRTSKEKAAMYDDGVRAVAEKLLPVLDNFERALNANDEKEDKFYQGVAMIARQFEGVLTDMGVEQIAALNETFDPNLHYAVAHAEDEALEANVITDEMQKGYKHKDKVIRPSMVKVAN